MKHVACPLGTASLQDSSTVPRVGQGRRSVGTEDGLGSAPVVCSSRTRCVCVRVCVLCVCVCVRVCVVCVCVCACVCVCVCVCVSEWDCEGYGVCSHTFIPYSLCAERENTCTFGKPNWFENVEAEHAAACSNVALFDLSSYAKLEIEVGLQYQIDKCCHASQPHIIAYMDHTSQALRCDHHDAGSRSGRVLSEALLQ